MDDRRIIPVADGTAILAENGPMRLVIQCRRGDTVDLRAARVAGQKAFSFLARVGQCREQLHRPAWRVDAENLDPIACKMVDAARTIGDPDLTPMAAVAGTLADFTADWLVDQGMTWVIVNNGGDIAIRLATGETARVGVRPDIGSQSIGTILKLDDNRGAWGVNTSGLGGRSLTRGIASAVTVVADCSAMADAAATAIANHCIVQDSRIVQVPAEQQDPDTDIPGIPVTVKVGRLDGSTIDTALTNGLDHAARLVRKDLIDGAMVTVQGRSRMTAGMKKILCMQA
jgi:ApbE superfamily uncharacterized protein (UPF0280 family)